MMPSPAPSPVALCSPALQRVGTITGGSNGGSMHAGGAAADRPSAQLPTLVLPAGTEVVGLVGEGLANAVFSFTLPRVGLPAEERSTFRGESKKRGAGRGDTDVSAALV
jgi:hypothetical protein